MVGLQDDREVGLLTLGQVAVGKRQPGRQDRRAVGQGSRRLADPCAHGQRDRGDGRERRATREERTVTATHTLPDGGQECGATPG